MKKQKYYAYFVPQTGACGVTEDWSKCEAKVKGKTGARFKAFDSKSDAEAWLLGGAVYEPKAMKPIPKLKPGIYFDAGTGRGAGVEVSVTDEKGKNLLHKALSKKDLNRFGKHRVQDDAATNNYGELLALRYALTIAKKLKVKKIFGDSKLVIDYWSKWHMKRKALPEETVELAGKVARMREAFEKRGGAVARITGDYNPADLGFHRNR
jgi:viroplasmin and RNaseH domain-containing protein